MPLRWKLFAVTGYLLAILFLIMAVGFSGVLSSAEEFNNSIINILLLIWSILGAMCCVTGIIVFHKFMPDKSWSKSFAVYFGCVKIVFILCTGVYIWLIIDFCMDISSSPGYRPEDILSLIIMLVCLVIMILHLAGMFRARKFIAANQQKKMDKLIDQIGE